MPEQFNCPQSGTSPDYDAGDDDPVIRCDFCNNRPTYKVHRKIGHARQGDTTTLSPKKAKLQSGFCPKGSLPALALLPE
jgi:hypothetical protein